MVGRLYSTVGECKDSRIILFCVFGIFTRAAGLRLSTKSQKQRDLVLPAMIWMGLRYIYIYSGGGGGGVRVCV